MFTFGIGRKRVEAEMPVDVLVDDALLRVDHRTTLAVKRRNAPSSTSKLPTVKMSTNGPKMSTKFRKMGWATFWSNFSQTIA
jgi:hypothetical protein